MHKCIPQVIQAPTSALLRRDANRQYDTLLCDVQRQEQDIKWERYPKAAGDLHIHAGSGQEGPCRDQEGVALFENVGSDVLVPN